MVKIRKGDKVMDVASSAFDNFYKGAGWELSQDESQEEEWDDVLAEEEVAAEKPLSQMNNTELIEKAISLGIKITGSPTNRQLRDMIRGAS